MPSLHTCLGNIMLLELKLLKLHAALLSFGLAVGRCHGLLEELQELLVKGLVSIVALKGQCICNI